LFGIVTAFTVMLFCVGIPLTVGTPPTTAPVPRFTVKLYARGRLLPLVLDATTVKLNVPAVVGFPEITPVLVLKVNPAGRLPAVTLQDVTPVAESV
jgi:hypothetical protein